MSDYAFRQQHLTHSILGYSANPSVDPSAPAVLGSVDVAQANGFSTIGSVKTSRSQKKALKRKRQATGNLEIVDGDDAYVGPWGSWQGDDIKENPVGAEGEEDESEEESEEEQVVRKRGKPKWGAPGQEHSVFHGKIMTDYQGRTYMHPPLVEAPQLQSEAGSQETFIPKTCVHTWTGHTQGVSVIRVLPNTGHLFLSGSMDTKIKVRLSTRLTSWGLKLIYPAVGHLHSRELPADVPRARKGCQGRDVLERRPPVPILRIRPADETVGYRDRSVPQPL